MGNNLYRIVCVSFFCFTGSYERVAELVEQGADVNEPDGDGASLLHWAAINNRKQIVQ